MSRATGFYDPNAGRYTGSDPAVAKAFRELQRQMQQLRPDPLFRIISAEPAGGCYLVEELNGLTNASGASTASLVFSLPTNTSRLLAVNTLEGGDSHFVPAGTIITNGSRRLNLDGTDTIFFMFAESQASGTNKFNGGGTNVIGGTNVSGGPGPGGGGLGMTCPMDCSSCPASYTLTLTSIGADPYGIEGTYTIDQLTEVDADGNPVGQCAWESTDAAQVDISCRDAYWYLSFTQNDPVIEFFALNVTGCPPTGTYTRYADGAGGSYTCTLS